jgi:hypothetical protein
MLTKRLLPIVIFGKCLRIKVLSPNGRSFPVFGESVEIDDASGVKSDSNFQQKLREFLSKTRKIIVNA